MPRKPDPLDVFIGNQIRAQRIAHRFSQAELGARLGIAGQQIGKYERALDRVPASRLCRIAAVLEVPVSVFLDEADPIASTGRAGFSASGERA